MESSLESCLSMYEASGVSSLEYFVLQCFNNATGVSSLEFCLF